jgi:hypothetical protein
MMNVSIGISQNSLQELLVCAIQCIQYINKDVNIMWNFKPLMSRFLAKYVENLPEK